MNYTKSILTTTQDFLSRLGFGPEVTVKVQFSEADDLYQILLESDQPALLIGFHGENLSAIQLLLSQHIHTAVGQWPNLSVNVNDYREHREIALKSLADSTVNRVLATGQPHSLPPLSASERRIIHLYLAEHPKVSTASQGTGRGRSVVISPK